MSSRFLIPVLCIGAVAFACGPRTRNDAGGKRKSDRDVVAQETSKTAPRTADARKGASTTPTFSTTLKVDADSSTVRLALEVRNTSSRRIELNFPSGQTYDFVILDSIGREVWHWGSGRMFTQSLRNRLLDGGESLEMKETWKSAALAPGRYVAVGTLRSNNYPMTQTTEFLVGATATVATREDP